MKKVILIFILFFSFVNLNSAYASEYNQECGLIEGQIDPNHFGICDESISFKMLSYMFGDLIYHDSVRPIIEVFVDLPDSGKQLSTLISPQITMLLTPFNYFIWSFGVVFLGFSGVMGLISLSKNGKSESQKNGKLISNSAKYLFAFIMIVPFGHTMLVHAIVMVFAVVSNPLADLFVKSYLHLDQVNSTKFIVNDRDILASSSDFATKLVQQELCQSRTSQQILNNKVTSTSSFNTESPDFISFSDNTIKEFKNISFHCLKYYEEAVPNSEFSGANHSYMINDPEYYNCDEYALVSSIKNNPSDFGYEHSCGIVNYTWPDLDSANVATNTSENDKKILEKYINIFKNNKDIFDISKEYPAFKAKFESEISNIIKNKTLSKLDKQIKLDQIRNDFSLSIRLRMDSTFNNDFKDIENVKNQRIKNFLISSMHLAVVNSLLGATENDIGNIGLVDKSQKIVKAVSPIFAAYNLANGGYDVSSIFENKDNFPYLTNDYENNYGGVKGGKYKYGIDFLREDSKKASVNLERAHCYDNWVETRDSRRTINAYNDVKDGDLDDLIDASSNFMNFECITLNSSKDDFEYVIGGNDKAFSDINADGSVSTDKEKINKIAVDFKKNNVVDEQLNYLVKIALIESYTFGVKKAAISSLGTLIKETADLEASNDLAKAGWAGLGSMMLNVSGQQSNARSLADMIISTAKSTAPFKIDEYNISFENSDSLIKNSQSSVEINNKLIPMNFGKMMFLGGTSDVSSDYNDSKSTKESKDLELNKMFMNTLRNTLLGSEKYLKMGNGMNENLSLNENLELCSKNQNCAPDDVDPLNALSMFGNDLIKNSIDILLMKAVVDFTATATDFDIPAYIPFAGQVGKVMSVISAIFSTMSVVLSVLAPLIYMQLFVGFIFAFGIAVIPFITIFGCIIAFLVLIFMMLIILPILIIKLGFIIDGKSNLSFSEFFKLTGGILLMPSLIAIGFLLSYNLVMVLIFFVNITIYPLLSGLGANGDIKMTLISQISIFVIYLTCIFIVVRLAFSKTVSFGKEILSHFRIVNTFNMAENSNSIMAQAVTAQMFTGAVESLVDGVNDGASKLNRNLGLGDKFRKFAFKDKSNKGDIIDK